MTPEPVYLCDIDGTIANIEHRLHHIKSASPNWRAFFAACVDDLPIEEVIELLRSLSESAEIIMVTGRSDEIEEPTLQWLRDYSVPFLSVYMRKAGDHRQDSVVKAELLDEILADWDEKTIVGVFEDRQQVVDMYRARGLRVYQVAAGKF